MKKQKIYILFDDTMDGESLQSANAALNLLLNAWSNDPYWKENLEAEVWLVSGQKHLHYLDLQQDFFENAIPHNRDQPRHQLGDILCHLLKTKPLNGAHFYRPQLMILSDVFIVDEVSLVKAYENSVITDCLFIDADYQNTKNLPVAIQLLNGDELNTHIAWGCIKQEPVIIRVEKSHLMFKRMLSAAEQGDVNAQVQLAAMYRAGLGVSRNISAAIEWYQSAAQQNHVDAQYQLGEFYLMGLTGKLDKREAEKWYFLAAEAGHADAQYRLGTLYKYVKNLPTNNNEALKWWKLAADQGHTNAQIELGKMYQLGRCVERDLHKAEGYFQQAAKDGNQVAQLHFNQLGNQSVNSKCD